MPSPGNQFFSSELGDIEEYFITDYEIIDEYIGDQLWVWGNNSYASLGINNTANKSTPVTTFAGGNNWKSISTNFHRVAIKTDGTLWTWGGSVSNTEGQLGNNNTTNRTTPVTTFAGGNNWKKCDCGSSSTLAIKTDGTLWTWGRNLEGQLGINNTINRSTPVTTFAGGNNWQRVSGGFLHTAAIKTDGTLWVWGYNGSGQLGINDTIDRRTPVTTFLGGNNWKQISSGGYHTAAIKTDGTLWVWGGGTSVTPNSGQLGINNTINRSTPVTTFLGGTNWRLVSCGQHFTSAIKTDGSLWNWGYNLHGQLGINNTINRSTPVTTFAGGTNWKQVSGKGYHSSAVKIDGTLWNWGWNFTGGLGNNNNSYKSTPVTTFAGGNNWKFVSSGGDSTSGIKSGLNVDLS